MLPHAQDHKRVFDGDRGENTGGMGACSPALAIDARMEREIVERIVAPTVAGLRAEGLDYRGVIFVGLMFAKGGPQVIEYNARFGDPETQPLLFRLESDLVPLLVGAAEGRLPAESPALRVGAARGVRGDGERELPARLPERPRDRGARRGRRPRPTPRCFTPARAGAAAAGRRPAAACSA